MGERVLAVLALVFVGVQAGQAQFSLTVVNDGKGTNSPAGTVSGLESGSMVDVSATPYAGYTFRAWEGDVGSLESGPLSATNRILMDGDKSIQATFTNLCTLTLIDPWGPGTGTQCLGVAAGTYTNLAVPDPLVPITTNSRWRCVGWEQGWGDIPSSGGRTNFGPYCVTNSSGLRWVWHRENRLVVSLTGEGLTVPQPGVYWYLQHTIVSITAMPYSGYVFSEWSGDTNIVAYTLTLTLIRPWEVTARFLPLSADTDSDGMPDAWETRYGLYAYRAVDAFEDRDGDGTFNVDEYIADTDPTNAISCFRVLAVSNCPPWQVYFSSSANRRYHLQFVAEMSDSNWVTVDGAADVQGNGGACWLTDTNGSPSRYYRIMTTTP